MEGPSLYIPTLHQGRLEAVLFVAVSPPEIALLLFEGSMISSPLGTIICGRLFVIMFYGGIAGWRGTVVVCVGISCGIAVGSAGRKSVTLIGSNAALVIGSFCC
jgi:hypothetical protein